MDEIPAFQMQVVLRNGSCSFAGLHGTLSCLAAWPWLLDKLSLLLAADTQGTEEHFNS